MTMPHFIQFNFDETDTCPFLSLSPSIAIDGDWTKIAHAKNNKLIYF